MTGPRSRASTGQASTGQTSTGQACVGILMLETQFERIVGDIGNPDTWPFPVRYGTVAGASAGRVVCDDPRLLRDAFVSAGRKLVAQGCRGITTSCGFLSLIQDELTDALGVPVATSSLLQVPMIAQMLPGRKRVGILTISASSLSPAHLAAAGVPTDAPIAGMHPEGPFSHAIFNNAPTLDVAACRRDLIDTAQAFAQREPDLGALVLECTNMAPYAEAIGRAIGLPVFSIYSLVSWFQAGLAPPVFQPI